MTLSPHGLRVRAFPPPFESVPLGSLNQSPLAPRRPAAFRRAGAARPGRSRAVRFPGARREACRLTPVWAPAAGGKGHLNFLYSLRRENLNLSTASDT